MNKKNTYLAPKVKVAVMRGRGVICQSYLKDQSFSVENGGEMEDGGDL